MTSRRRHRVAAGVVLCALIAIGCHAPDPQQELTLLDLETYWAVGAPSGATQHLAPVVRFRVRHKGTEEHRAVEATATFRQKGDTLTWGSDWRRVTGLGHPLRPGDTVLMELQSDGRYTSTGTPQAMLENSAFRDATVDVFLKIGSSPWSKFAHLDVERRIGSRSVTEQTDVPPNPTMPAGPDAGEGF